MRLQVWFMNVYGIFKMYVGDVYPFRHSCVLTYGKITGGSDTFEHLEMTEVISWQHLSLTFEP